MKLIPIKMTLIGLLLMAAGDGGVFVGVLLVGLAALLFVATNK